MGVMGMNDKTIERDMKNGICEHEQVERDCSKCQEIEVIQHQRYVAALKYTMDKKYREIRELRLEIRRVEKEIAEYWVKGRK